MQWCGPESEKDQCPPERCVHGINVTWNVQEPSVGGAKDCVGWYLYRNKSDVKTQ